MYFLRRDEDEWDGDHSYEVDPEVAIDAPEEDDRECPDCGAYIEEDAEEVTTWNEEEQSDITRVDGHEEDCQEPEWRAEESIAMHFNAAGVRIREDENRSEVQVWISVGDPRGAFCMTLEFMTNGDHKGELRLSVPTPTDGLLHCPLTQLGSPGYYKVN